jgi:periplasmic divalent cation tolerance protein
VPRGVTLRSWLGAKPADGNLEEGLLGKWLAARALGSEPTMDPTDVLVVLVTAPSQEKAVEIARAVVEARLAACGNVVPGLRSIYRWEGRVHDDAEALLVLKTTRARFEALRDRVLALHPYEVPEVLALPVEAGSAAYAEWIAGETA